MKRWATYFTRSWRMQSVIRIAVMSITASSAGIAPSEAMPPHPDLADRIATGEVRVPQCNISSPAEAYEQARWFATWRAGGAAVDTFRTLAILIEYSDVAAQTATADFDTLLYVLNQGSVRDFYLENSYQQLDMVTVNFPSTTGWQTAPQTQSYYSNAEYGLGGSSYPNNAKKLVEDAVAAVDGVVDFSQYDNDNNGWVDALMIIHAGPGAEFTGDTDDIWSHKWGISAQNRDGVFVSSYAMMPEYWTSPGDITVGVFAHELGHVFGLPDFYDTDYSSNGIGRWSAMAGGSWNGILGNSPAHFDAWCKVQLGFLTPITPTTQVLGASLPQVETDSVIFRLWDNGSAGNEYFLVENRQRVGFDAGLPSAGMLIWHIDDGVATDNNNEWYPGFTSSGHYQVALEQADGDWDLEQDVNSGDSGDPYPGASDVRDFNSTTTPDSKDYNDAVSFVVISNISDSDSLMTADFTVSLIAGLEDNGILPATPETAYNFPNPFNAQTRIQVNVTEAGPVEVQIYNVLGGLVRRLASPFEAPGTWTVNWDGTNAAGVIQSSGVYWYRVVTADRVTQGKMVMVK